VLSKDLHDGEKNIGVDVEVTEKIPALSAHDLGVNWY
jgi:hypothetical protein